jgi:hypothetical protein
LLKILLVVQIHKLHSAKLNTPPSGTRPVQNTCRNTETAGMNPIQGPQRRAIGGRAARKLEPPKTALGASGGLPTRSDQTCAEHAHPRASDQRAADDGADQTDADVGPA